MRKALSQVLDGFMVKEANDAADHASWGAYTELKFKASNLMQDVAGSVLLELHGVSLLEGVRNGFENLYKDGPQK